MKKPSQISKGKNMKSLKCNLCKRTDLFFLVYNFVLRGVLNNGVLNTFVKYN
jgi:hypothetical protein